MFRRVLTLAVLGTFLAGCAGQPLTEHGPQSVRPASPSVGLASATTHETRPLDPAPAPEATTTTSASALTEAMSSPERGLTVTGTITTSGTITGVASPVPPVSGTPQERLRAVQAAWLQRTDAPQPEWIGSEPGGRIILGGEWTPTTPDPGQELKLAATWLQDTRVDRTVVLTRGQDQPRAYTMITRQRALAWPVVTTQLSKAHWLALADIVAEVASATDTLEAATSEGTAAASPSDTLTVVVSSSMTEDDLVEQVAMPLLTRKVRAVRLQMGGDTVPITMADLQTGCAAATQPPWTQLCRRLGLTADPPKPPGDTPPGAAPGTVPSPGAEPASEGSDLLTTLLARRYPLQAALTLRWRLTLGIWLDGSKGVVYLESRRAESQPVEARLADVAQVLDTVFQQAPEVGQVDLELQEGDLLYWLRMSRVEWAALRAQGPLDPTALQLWETAMQVLTTLPS